MVHLTIGTGALTGISFSQSIFTSERGQSAAINLLTVILFRLPMRGTLSAGYGLAIVLSKLYANSMMVFLNDRIPSSHHDVHAMSNVTSLGPHHFRTVAGSADG